MSSMTDTLDDALRTETGDGPLLLRRLSSPLSAVAFWLAVGMPMAYLPVFFTGLDSQRDLLVFVALLCVHVVALRVGRSHRRE